MGQYPQPRDFTARNRAAEAMRAYRAATLASASYLTEPFRITIHSGITYGEQRRPRLAAFPNPPPKRGQVKSLSSAARRRLTRFFAEINTEQLSAPVFVTLTFRNDRAKEESYRCLRVWLKSIRRHYHGMQWLWRMELQQRGVVHFHLFLWHRPGNDQFINDPRLHRWLSREWHRIADPRNKAHGRYGCLVEPIQNRRKARQYVAKYCAKESPNDAELIGRRWGHSASIPREPMLSFDLSDRQAILFRRIARRLMDRHHPTGAQKPEPTHRRRIRQYAAHASKIALYADVATAARILRDVCMVPERFLDGLSQFLPPCRVQPISVTDEPRARVTACHQMHRIQPPSAPKRREALPQSAPTTGARLATPSLITAPHPSLTSRGHAGAVAGATTNRPGRDPSGYTPYRRRIPCTFSRQTTALTPSNVSSSVTNANLPQSTEATHSTTSTRYACKTG